MSIHRLKWQQGRKNAVSLLLLGKHVSKLFTADKSVSFVFLSLEQCLRMIYLCHREISTVAFLLQRANLGTQTGFGLCYTFNLSQKFVKDWQKTELHLGDIWGHMWNHLDFSYSIQLHTAMLKCTQMTIIFLSLFSLQPTSEISHSQNQKAWNNSMLAVNIGVDTITESAFLLICFIFFRGKLRVTVFWELFQLFHCRCTIFFIRQMDHFFMGQIVFKWCAFRAYECP